MWWMAAGAAVSIGSQILGSSNTKDQIKNQQAWAEYNAQVQYNVDVNNIKAQTQVTEMNAAMMIATTEMSNQANDALIAYNTTVLEQTALYNDMMYEQDLANMWTQAGLDIELIGMQRQRERGVIEATQSASGTVMGEGSNADVVIDQMTQEELDKFIVLTGADMQAANITNARMRSLYDSQQEINKIAFEGRVASRTSSLNASLSAMAMLAENEIRSIAGMSEAEIRRSTGISNSENAADQLNARNEQDFVSGMFGIASNVIGQAGSSLNIKGTGTTTGTPGSAPVSISSGGAGGQTGTTTILAGNYKNKLVT